MGEGLRLGAKKSVIITRVAHRRDFRGEPAAFYAISNFD